MDENGIAQPDLRKFSRPFCLLSLVFFLPYVIILCFLAILIAGSDLGRSPSPSTGYMVLGFLSTAICGFVYLISCAGAFLILREMKEQGLPWRSALPLCVMFGVIFLLAVSAILSSQYFLYLIIIAGFMCLPAGVAYLLQSFPDPKSAGVRSFVKTAGIFGGILACLLLLAEPVLSWIRGPDIIFPFIILTGIFHLLLLTPLAGEKIFMLGIGFAKIPPCVVEPARVTEAVPRKKIPEIIGDIRKSMSPRVKWTIIAVVALIIVVAAWYVYLDISDTTPCRRWTQMTPDALFGGLSGFSSAEFEGKLWLLGGSGNGITNADAWYTSDGITWVRVLSDQMAPRHVGATSAVFRDALWIIGGTDEKNHTPGNDIWFSGNGIVWTEMEPKSVFPPRSWHSTVVYHDRIWVIGGNRGTMTTDLAGDVWYSDDGITWVQATPAAGFSPRSDMASFVYQDKIWVIGGCDPTGFRNDIWNSDDGVTWTLVNASAPFTAGTSFSAVVFDGRMWVFQTSEENNPDAPWATERRQGIWYSYDGITWTKVNSSPEFFRSEYNGGQPVPLVFQNRLYILQRYGTRTGVWYTMPSGP